MFVILEEWMNIWKSWIYVWNLRKFVSLNVCCFLIVVIIFILIVLKIEEGEVLLFMVLLRDCFIEDGSVVRFDVCVCGNLILIVMWYKGGEEIIDE